MSHSTLPSCSPTDPSAAGVKPQLAPEIAAAAASNSTSGFIRSCPRDELAGPRFPPHMRDAVGALRLTRNALSVCLAEETIFIRPPRADVRADEKNMHGMGSSIRGFVNIVSTARRFVQDVRVSLTGTQVVAFPSGATDECEVFRRELSLADLTGAGLVTLERGVNCFEFSLVCPKEMPVSVRSTYGRLRYVLGAHAPGSGSILRGQLAAEREVYIVGLPELSEEDKMRIAVDEHGSAAWSGPSRLELRSDRLSIGDPIACELTLASPPANLTIFGIHVYLQQTVVMRSPKSTGPSVVVNSQRTLARAGYLTRWKAPDFVARTRSDCPSRLLLDGTASSGQESADPWTWSADGVLPFDNTIKPTTVYYTDSTPGLTFAHQLVVDVYYQQTGAGVADDRPKMESVFKRAVTVTSSKCDFETLTLPAYTQTVAGAPSPQAVAPGPAPRHT